MGGVLARCNSSLCLEHFLEIDGEVVIRFVCHQTDDCPAGIQRMWWLNLMP